MKHAEHWGFACTPTLNHTGELKATFCSTSRWASSSRKMFLDSGVAKYPPSSPQRTIVSTTRLINCRTEVSRSGELGFPWKYFEATMFVAVCDHDFGTSTLSCRKITWPLSFPMIAGRRSHSTLSNGDTFPSVKRRWNSRPEARRVTCSVSDLPCKVILTSAISPSAPGVKPSYVGWTAVRGEELLFYSQTTGSRVSLCVSRNTRNMGKRERVAGVLLQDAFQTEKIEKPS